MSTHNIYFLWRTEEKLSHNYHQILLLNNSSVNWYIINHTIYRNRSSDKVLFGPLILPLISSMYNARKKVPISYANLSDQSLLCRSRSSNMRKRTFRHVRPTKIQISLWFSRVWSESLFSTQRNFASLASQNALSEDSDQTVQIEMNLHLEQMSRGAFSYVEAQIHHHLNWQRSSD